MRRGLGLLPCTRDAAVPVELEGDLGAFDPERTARETALADRGGEPVGSLEGRRNVGLGLAALGLRVRQPRATMDHGAIEPRLAARRQLDRDAEPVLVRPETAAVIRELRREHR